MINTSQFWPAVWQGQQSFQKYHIFDLWVRWMHLNFGPCLAKSSKVFISILTLTLAKFSRNIQFLFHQSKINPSHCWQWDMKRDRQLWLQVLSVAFFCSELIQSIRLNRPLHSSKLQQEIQLSWIFAHLKLFFHKKFWKVMIAIGQANCLDFVF